MEELKKIVEHQSKMESLWVVRSTVTEALLMAALRHLHAVIENDPLIAKETKKIYWNVDEEL